MKMATRGSYGPRDPANDRRFGWKPINGGDRFTAEQNAEFKREWELGTSTKLLAYMFDRSISSVKNHRRTLKLKPRKSIGIYREVDFRVKLTEKQHRAIAMTAANRGVSKTQLLRNIITQYTGISE